MSEFLSTQITDLDSPGIDAGDLYYSRESVQLTDLESQTRVGRTKISLTSALFGSTGECQIANQSFISNCYLLLESPQLPVGCSLSSNWITACIKQVRFQFGSSDVGQVTYSGMDLFHKNFLDATSKEKRDACANISGTFNMNGVRDTGPVPVAAQTRMIQLPLPWSSLKPGKKPYDSSLLSSPIIVQIVFEDSSSFISVNSGAVILPNSFLQAQLIVKTTDLSDHSKSLRSDLRRNDNLMGQYVYNHFQTGSTRYLSAVNPLTTVNVDLTNFISSDLLGISYSVHPLSQLQRTGFDFATGTGIVNKLDTISTSDISLKYNGSVLYDCPGILNFLNQLSMVDSDNTAGNYTLLQQALGVTSAVATTNEVTYLPFTKDMSVTFNGDIPNTPRLGQQTLVLSFVPALPAQTDIVLFTTYHYTGVAATTQGMNVITYG